MQSRPARSPKPGRVAPGAARCEDPQARAAALPRPPASPALTRRPRPTRCAGRRPSSRARRSSRSGSSSRPVPWTRLRALQPDATPRARSRRRSARRQRRARPSRAEGAGGPRSRAPRRARRARSRRRRTSPDPGCPVGSCRGCAAASPPRYGQGHGRTGGACRPQGARARRAPVGASPRSSRPATRAPAPCGSPGGGTSVRWHAGSARTARTTALIGLRCMGFSSSVIPASCCENPGGKPWRPRSEVGPCYR